MNSSAGRCVSVAGLAAGLMVLAPVAALALDPIYNCEWIASGNWSNPSTWRDCGGGVPGVRDRVFAGWSDLIVKVDGNYRIAYLSINYGGAGMVLAPGSSLTVEGDLKLQPNGVGISGSGDLTIEGDFDTRGLVNLSAPSTVTLRLNPERPTTTLWGTRGESSTFANLVLEAEGPRTLRVMEGTELIVTGSLVLRGASSRSRLKVLSTLRGSQWSIDARGSVDMDNLELQDSRDTGAPLTLRAQTNLDRGNNDGWSFETMGPRLPDSTGQVIAQVARAQGFGSAFWTTDLELTNPTGSEITSVVYYTPRAADGLTGALQATVTVPAGATRTVSDVVGTLFATTGAGSLEVVSPLLIVATRTATPASSGGSFGQGVPPVSSGQQFGLPDVDQEEDEPIPFPGSARGGGVVAGGGARSNLALNEMRGEALALAVKLLDRDGATLGEVPVNLPPYGNVQIDNLAGAIGGLGDLAEGQVVVTAVSGNGRAAATLFIVDGSDDPSTVPLPAVW